MALQEERRLPLTSRPGADKNRTGPFGEGKSLLLLGGMVGLLVYNLLTCEVTAGTGDYGKAPE
jgi:hypothetical protein